MNKKDSLWYCVEFDTLVLLTKNGDMIYNGTPFCENYSVKEYKEEYTTDIFVGYV